MIKMGMIMSLMSLHWAAIRWAFVYGVIVGAIHHRLRAERSEAGVVECCGGGLLGARAVGKGVVAVAQSVNTQEDGNSNSFNRSRATLDQSNLPWIELPMLIRLVLRIDMFVANQRLLLGTAWARINDVIVRLLLAHCGLVTEERNWPIGVWNAVWGIFARWCRVIIAELRRLRYVHAVKEFSNWDLCDFCFTSLSLRIAYFVCLADIPEPLRELNDDFLQFPTIPVPKGSGGGCWGGGGRKSIQLVGAVR